MITGRAAGKKGELQTTEAWTSRRENPFRTIQSDGTEEVPVSMCRRAYIRDRQGRDPQDYQMGQRAKRSQRQQRWVGPSTRADGRGHMKNRPAEEGDGLKGRHGTSSPGVRRVGKKTNGSQEASSKDRLMRRQQEQPSGRSTDP